MLKVGDIVNYHSIIGGPITSQCHGITHIGQRLRKKQKLDIRHCWQNREYHND